MSKIECEIVPLYRLSIVQEYSDGDEYDWVLVSDTITGIIEGIVEREICVDSIKDCRKYLIITDFLVMPCERACRGYHLFDIDEHDLSYSSPTFDEKFYDMRFSGDHPKPVENTSTFEDHVHDPRDADSVMSRISAETAFADAVYNISLTHPYRQNYGKEDAARSRENLLAAEKRIREILSEEEKEG